MSEKIFFKSKIKEDLFDFIESKSERRCINFLNLHDIYQFKKNILFRRAITRRENLNFIDGFVISAYLSLFNLRRVPRTRGPTFTRDFLSNPELSKNKVHFFIGLEKKDLIYLKKKFPHLRNIYCYNPPYIKQYEFSKEELAKMIKAINSHSPNFVWVCVGSPKQNILSLSLFGKTKTQYFLNVGAALDFLLDKKKEAPLIVRELGIEWLYRLITDFKYSKKKVWRSFIGLFYLLLFVRLENE